MAMYEWVDSIPLSCKKKNFARDFSNGVLLAEIIKYYRPKLVHLHNYQNANYTSAK